MGAGALASASKRSHQGVDGEFKPAGGIIGAGFDEPRGSASVLSLQTGSTAEGVGCLHFAVDLHL